MKWHRACGAEENAPESGTIFSYYPCEHVLPVGCRCSSHRLTTLRGTQGCLGSGRSFFGLANNLVNDRPSRFVGRPPTVPTPDSAAAAAAAAAGTPAHRWVPRRVVSRWLLQWMPRRWLHLPWMPRRHVLWGRWRLQVQLFKFQGSPPLMSKGTSSTCS